MWYNLNMDCKNEVLKKLELNRGKYVSGEKLAKELDISRQAVSKCVKSLIESGYVIYSKTNCGYLLDEKCDLINAAVIEKLTGAKTFCFSNVDSTNTRAQKLYCDAGECIVCALSQTAGRKKDGESFFSPYDKGIYLSIALPLSISAEEALPLRQIAAKATRLAIYNACAIMPEIENVDELFIDGKKVAGILIEGVLNTAIMKIKSAVIGIGVYTAPTPSDDEESDAFALNGFLGAIYPEETRNKLIADIYLNIKSFLKTANFTN